MFVLAVLACNGTPDEPTPTGDVTYYEDVAPIIMDNCVSCHVDGQIAPFELRDYATVSVVGTQVADSVVHRRMPPFLADNSGDCRTYEDAAWLSDDEIQTIVDWVDGGMPEGDPANGPSMPDPLGGLDDRTTHSLVMDFDYFADFEGQDDDYRCFVIDPGLTEDGFITAFEIEPGDPEIVHHVIVYAPVDDNALANAYELDDETPTEGYTCFGGPSVDASMVAAWAPGRMVWEYPDGTGIRVEEGMPLIVQMHYNNGGSSNVDSTTVNFEIVDQVDDELYSWFWVNSGIEIPPGEEHVETTYRSTLSRYTGIDDLEVTLLGVGPHMHSIGTALYADVTDGETGDTECLMDLPRWDFNWQFAYMFEEPVEMTFDDRLFLQCDYDSSDRDEWTYWGDGTGDEMCLITMYTTVQAGI